MQGAKCRCLFLAINILSYKYVTQRIMKQCVVVTLLLGSSIVLPKKHLLAKCSPRAPFSNSALGSCSLGNVALG